MNACKRRCNSFVFSLNSKFTPSASALGIVPALPPTNSLHPITANYSWRLALSNDIAFLDSECWPRLYTTSLWQTGHQTIPHRAGSNLHYAKLCQFRSLRLFSTHCFEHPDGRSASHQLGV